MNTVRKTNQLNVRSQTGELKVVDEYTDFALSDFDSGEIRAPLTRFYRTPEGDEVVPVDALEFRVVKSGEILRRI